MEGNHPTLPAIHHHTPRSSPPHSPQSTTTLPAVHHHTPRSPPPHSPQSTTTLPTVHHIHYSSLRSPYVRSCCAGVFRITLTSLDKCLVKNGFRNLQEHAGGKGAVTYTEGSNCPLNQIHGATLPKRAARRRVHARYMCSCTMYALSIKLGKALEHAGSPLSLDHRSLVFCLAQCHTFTSLSSFRPSPLTIVVSLHELNQGSSCQHSRINVSCNGDRS